MSGETIGHAPWMTLPETKAVIAALEARGYAGCARFVGGCVRNTLMGKPIDDVDTHLIAERLLRRLRSIIARRPGAYHRDVPHASSRFCRDASAAAGKGKRAGD